MPNLLDVDTGVALARRQRAQQYHLEAAGLRKDGALVMAYNDRREIQSWEHHAESRLCRKLTPDSVIAVVRVLMNGSWHAFDACEELACERFITRLSQTSMEGFYSNG